MSPFGRGGLNAYVYCSGDPINHDDPSGHFGELGILGVLSSMVDAVVAEEEAANIAATVRALVDTVAIAQEVGPDAGVAEVNATRATANAIDERVASSSRTATRVEAEADALPAKRPRMEESEIRRLPEAATASYAEMRRSLGDVRTQLDDLEPRMTSRLNELFEQPRKDDTIRSRWRRGDRFMARHMFLHSGEGHKNALEGYATELNAINTQLKEIHRRGQDLPDGRITEEVYDEFTVVAGRHARLSDEWNLHKRILADIARTIVP